MYFYLIWAYHQLKKQNIDKNMHNQIQGVSKLTFLTVAAVQRCNFGTERNRLTGPQWSHSDSADDGPAGRIVRVYIDTYYHIYNSFCLGKLSKKSLNLKIKNYQVCPKNDVYNWTDFSWTVYSV